MSAYELQYSQQGTIANILPRAQIKHDAPALCSDVNTNVSPAAVLIFQWEVRGDYAGYLLLLHPHLVLIYFCVDDYKTPELDHENNDDGPYQATRNPLLGFKCICEWLAKDTSTILFMRHAHFSVLSLKRQINK